MTRILAIAALLPTLAFAGEAPEVHDLTSLSSDSAADAMDRAKAQAMQRCKGPAIVIANVQNRLDDRHSAHIWFTCATGRPRS